MKYQLNYIKPIEYTSVCYFSRAAENNTLGPAFWQARLHFLREIQYKSHSIPYKSIFNDKITLFVLIQRFERLTEVGTEQDTCVFSMFLNVKSHSS